MGFKEKIGNIEGIMGWEWRNAKGAQFINRICNHFMTE